MEPLHIPQYRSGTGDKTARKTVPRPSPVRQPAVQEVVPPRSPSTKRALDPGPQHYNYAGGEGSRPQKTSVMPSATQEDLSRLNPSMTRTAGLFLQHYSRAAREGTHPGMALFALPASVVKDGRLPPTPMQNAEHKPSLPGSDGRLSAVAARRGVHKLDLSTAEFKGIDKQPEVTDLPRIGQVDTAPEYVKAMQGARKLATSHQPHRPEEPGLISAGSPSSGSRALLKRVNDHLSPEAKRQLDSIRQPSSLPPKALVYGVAMEHVEKGRRTKEICDSHSVYRRQRTRHQLHHQPAQNAVPRPPQTTAAQPQTPAPNDTQNDIATPTGPAPSLHPCTDSENSSPPNRGGSMDCTRGPDGGYRAPEIPVSESRMELEYQLRLMRGYGNFDWVQDEDDEWRRMRRSEPKAS